MKRSIMYLFAVLLLSSSARAQFKEFDFENFLYDPLPCNPFVTNKTDFLDPWKASHGSPQITGSARNIAQLRASYTYSSQVYDYEEKTEGVFLSYEFKQGHLYEIEVVIKSSNGQTGIEVYAANGISATTEQECVNAKVPSVSDKSLLVENPQVPSFGYSGYTYDFIPAKKYSSLWILSRQVYLNLSGILYVSHVTIHDRGVQDSQPPTVPTGLRAANVTTNSIALQWNASSDNKGVSSYEIYAGSSKLATSTSTSKTISGLASCSQYNNLKVRAVDATGNKSGFSSAINVSTRGTVTTLNNDLTSRRTYTAQDSEVRMTNGFVFRAVDTSYEFVARPTSCSSARVATALLKPAETPEKAKDYVALKATRTVKVIEEDFKGSNTLYPNPTSGIVSIRGKNRVGRFALIDLTGNLLKEGDFEQSIDLSKYKSGIYFLRFFNENGVVISTEKVVKK